MSYNRMLCRRSWKDTCDLVFGAPFFTFVIGIIAAAVAIYLQRLFTAKSGFDMKEALVSLGFGICANAMIFVYIFLFYSLYAAPKQMNLEADGKLVEARETLKKLQDSEAKEFDETYYSIVEWIRNGHYPLYALQEHKIDEFRSNDDVVRLCDRLVSDKHEHPFGIIMTVIPQSEWLNLLKWARGRGAKFYDATDTYKWTVDLLKERGGRPVSELGAIKPPS